MPNTDVKIDSIVRTAVLIITLLNQVLTSYGHGFFSFSDEELNTTVTVVLTCLVSIWTWWKNNSFTKQAIVADDLKNDLKAIRKDDLRKIKEVKAVKAGDRK